jgi:hypothetical protein
MMGDVPDRVPKLNRTLSRDVPLYRNLIVTHVFTAGVNCAELTNGKDVPCF